MRWRGRGRVFGLFLIGYALARLFVERFRQADAQFVTPGQSARPRARLGAARADHGAAPVAAHAGRRPRPASSARRAARDPARRRVIRGAHRRRGAAAARRLHGACLGHPSMATTRPATRSAPPATSSPRPRSARCSASWSAPGLAQVWDDQGRPEPFVLAELGPGRGTLMRDALRAARRRCRASATPPGSGSSRPAPRSAPRQAADAGRAPRRAGPTGPRSCRPGPLFVVANEFFDALPIRQVQRTDALWRERAGRPRRRGGSPSPGGRRGPTPTSRRGFPTSPDGAVVEVAPPARRSPRALGARIARDGGAALIVDYGAWDGSGDTLQAVRGHAPADPLAAPRRRPTSPPTSASAPSPRPRGRRAPSGPLPQGAFLERARHHRAGAGAGARPRRRDASTPSPPRIAA